MPFEKVAVAQLLLLAVALEHRGQRRERDVRERDQVVRAHEQVELGGQDPAGLLLEQREVQDDEDVVVVLVELRRVVARVDVLVVERVEVEVGLEPVAIGGPRRFDVDPADAGGLDDLRHRHLGRRVRVGEGRATAAAWTRQRSREGEVGHGTIVVAGPRRRPVLTALRRPTGRPVRTGPASAGDPPADLLRPGRRPTRDRIVSAPKKKMAPADREQPADATDRRDQRADRRPDDARGIERQVDEVEGRRAAVGRELGGEQSEDHRADRGGRRARARRRAGRGARSTARQRHQDDHDARPGQGGDEHRPEADPVADHATDRRHERPDERRGPGDEGDRRGQAGPGTGDALDEDRDVRPAHLDGDERDPEDREDPAGRAVGQHAAQRRRTRGRRSGRSARPRAGPRASRT